MGGASCIVHAVSRVSPEEPARFGFIVSKAVGNAVTRNRVRRQMQAMAQAHLGAGVAGVDVIVRVLPAAVDSSFADLSAQFAQQLTRAIRRAVRTGEP